MTDDHLSNSPEIWKGIPGFPGYEVSDQGRVRSYWKRVGVKGQWPGVECVLDSNPQRILRHTLNKKGYPTVYLSVKGKKHTRTIHRLVLLVFRGPCPPGMEACHNDGIKVHCTIGNLRWDTSISNHLDRHKHGAMHDFKGLNNPRCKLTESKVINIRYLNAQGYTPKELSKMFFVTPENIQRIIKRRTWLHI